jgi:diguanylate cyclase (GGDEF)-like protein/PAS domain S-box-containing protein
MIMDIDDQRKASDALKESERSKSVLLSNLPGLAYRCDYDREWTMRFISPGCFKLTGYRPKSLLGNSEVSYNELIAPEYRQAIWDEWERVISRKLSFRYEYEIITAGGERKWVFEQGQAILSPDGSVEALEGLIIDINDRKRKEEEVRYLNDRDYLTGLYNRRYFEISRRIMDSSGKLPLSIIVGDINGLKFINDALGHAEGDILIMETSKLLKNATRPQDVLSRTGGDEFMLLMPNTGRSEAARIMQDIRRNVEQHNVSISVNSFYISISLGFASKDHPFEDFDRVMREAEDMMYRGKLAEHKQAYRLLIDSIMTKVSAKSHESPEHARRVATLSSSIARILGLSDQQISDLTLAAMLHDIGNISVAGDILAKRSQLTDNEWAEVRRHPMVGYRIAKASEELSGIADYVLSHHERWDGTGYPNSMKDEEIPLLSRIIAVADAFDAMTHDRAYRKAMTEAEALEEIEKKAGTQFDPDVVSALIRLFKLEQA